MRIIDAASLEAAITKGERLADQLKTSPGHSGVAARLGLSCYRALFTALSSEIDRGTNPTDMMRGLEPLVANALASILVNTGAGEDAIRGAVAKMVPGVPVRGERVKGFCFMMAGFRAVGETKSGKLAWQLLPRDMPPPQALPEAA